MGSAHNPSMSETLTLSCEGLRCEIRPDMGCCIAGLYLDGVPVLRSTPAQSLMSARLSGSYPLVPFSNRVAHASLQWEGTAHPLVRFNGDEPHAIHGVGWQRPWEVLERDERFAMLAFEHKADEAWPFAFDCSQTFRLGTHTLEMTLSITNQSAATQPVGLGWHPYFVKRAQSRIAFEATGRWEMSAEKLPTRRLPARGLDTDCATLDVDHCFDGWGGVVYLRDELLYTQVTSNMSRLVVFTNATKDFIAIEPVSHVNNAIHLAQTTGADPEDLGLRILQPGESMSAQMSIQVEHLKKENSGS
jgi:aldose 1-epimerase